MGEGGRGRGGVTSSSVIVHGTDLYAYAYGLNTGRGNVPMANQFVKVISVLSVNVGGRELDVDVERP